MQTYPKILRKLRLCAGCDKKETGCTRASAPDTLDRHQLVTVSMGVSKLGEWSGTDLIFIDARVKLNDTYYREVFLTQKLLLVMREICSEFCIFRQGNVHAHRAIGAINLLKQDTCVYFPDLLPPTSTDLPVDYRNIEKIQQRVYDMTSMN